MDRIRKTFNADTGEYLPDEILNLNPFIKYNTNVYAFPTQPEETFNPDVYVLLDPLVDVLPTDWIKKDGLEFKIKKWQMIEYAGKTYLLKVWY